VNFSLATPDEQERDLRRVAHRETGMLKTISAIAAAAAIAAAVTAWPSLSARVEAGSPAVAASPDPLDTVQTAPSCARQAWPYFETECLRDSNRPMGQARAVRVVTTDRNPVESATAALR
jgi:hypothetical protein